MSETQTKMSVAALEAEERLAALSDQAARFAELVAAAYARAVLADGRVQSLAARHDVIAAISAVRERNLADEPNDVKYLRRLLHGAAYFAFRYQDHRGVTNTVRLLAELDGHLEKDRQPVAPSAVNIQINIGAPMPGEGISPAGQLTLEAQSIEVGGRRITAPGLIDVLS